MIAQPADFSTYFLTILISNFILSLFYYLITKIIYCERPSLRPILYFIACVIFWLVGVVFYSKTITDWLKSPALSRNGNEECILLDFFDSHDLWHFLSAFALFFSFLMLMTLDDQQEGTPRRDLRVF